MDIEITQQRLDKLAGIEQKNKLRLQKFMKKKKQQGYKQISCLVSSEIYNKICDIRDNSIKQNSPISVSDIITKAISDIDLQVFKTTFKDNVSINDIKQPSKSSILSDTQFKAENKPIQDDNSDIGVSMASAIDSDSKAIESDSKRKNRKDINPDFNEKKCIMYIHYLKETEKRTYSGIVEELNKHGWKTAKNKDWNYKSFDRFYNRKKHLYILEAK